MSLRETLCRLTLQSCRHLPERAKPASPLDFVGVAHVHRCEFNAKVLALRSNSSELPDAAQRLDHEAPQLGSRLARFA